LIRTAIRIREYWFQAEDQMSLLRTRHFNESARIERSRFVDLRSWLETLVAAVIAAAVANLGYKFLLMGY
jgi:hypothetical protein